MEIGPLSAEDIRRENIDAIISDKACVDVEAFDQDFRDAARNADEAGDESRAKVLRLFGAICSFHFIPHDRTEPFSNMVTWTDGSRSMVGSDLEKDVIDQLDAVRNDICTPSLRTRIADLVWSRDKGKHASGRAAVDGYVELLQSLLDGSGTLRFESPGPLSVSSEKFLERAIAIAKSLGWYREENETLKEVGKAIVVAAEAAGDMSLVRFGQMALDAGLEVDDILDSLPNAVDAALEKSDFMVAENLQKLSIRYISSRSEDRETPPDSALRLAEIYEMRAEASDAAFLQTHALQEAIDSLHGVRGVREKRQKLHEKLRQAQIHMSDEFTPITHSSDISDAVAQILRGYDGLDLLDSLRQLALAELPEDPETLQENARKEAERFPLSSLFSTAILDSKGRTTARTGGGIENNDTLRHKIIQHEQIHIGLAVAAAIAPVRGKIVGQFRIDQRLFFEICRISPFVPSGAESVMARGFHAFMYGDEIVASACLIPYLESGLRSMVVGAGRLDTTIALGGIEQTIGLGPLLSGHRDALEKVFGRNIVYAIENLFVHPLGAKVRHNFCHGLTADGAFFSPSYVYACKLIFSLAILPLSGEDWPKIKEYLIPLV